MDKNLQKLINDVDKKIIIDEKFKEIGFLYVTLDIGGYRMGSMNATLKDKA